MKNNRTEVLVFALDGMRFALPYENVVELLPVDGERWHSLAVMAEAGTLKGTGLALLRLSARLGLVRPGQARREAPRAGALLLIGQGGRVRGTVLLDAEPILETAEVLPIPAAVATAHMPAGEMIAGMAVLPGGTRAILLDLPIGIAATRTRPAEKLRALVVAPSGEACERQGLALRELGYEVSLADDPRAPTLSGRRYDIVLVDLDAYGAALDRLCGASRDIAPADRPRLIGIARRAGAVVPPGFDAVLVAGDTRGLVRALLRGTRAA
ncbi:chemotaxis protein CheW [Ancylobacter sp. 6x-1]|uniref:Chemotaxis protein CheW n=1 Tax=Ancylobacter crimeensis TaxID=2579147 RepID=A0ABT0D9C0_9HYPH|nr:chemotaxis protein CheW [Ancylobacter crimeensis]MCK0196551.1 chemotaxis protein CheW [Ancylobacter crimeensis]